VNLGRFRLVETLKLWLPLVPAQPVDRQILHVLENVVRELRGFSRLGQLNPENLHSFVLLRSAYVVNQASLILVDTAAWLGDV
jgi:hypothetical protein